MRRWIPVLFVSLVLAAGCGSQARSRGVQPSPVPSNVVTSSTSTTVGPSIGPTEAGPTDGVPTVAGPSGSATTSLATIIPNSCAAERKGDLGVQVGSSAATAMQLTNVEVRQLSACSDVVKFTFFSPSKAAPSYNVSVQPGPFTRAGSGASVVIPGTKFVVLRFEPAATYDFTAGTPSYVGSESITPRAAAAVKRVELIDDSEGVVVWVVGLNEAASYEVLTTSNPPTLQLTVHR